MDGNHHGLIDQVVTLNEAWLEPIVEFFVPGTPATAGSKRAFYNAKIKRAMVVPANEEKERPWRAVVSAVALQEWVDGPIQSGPLLLSTEFVLKRPKGHFGTGRNAGQLKGSALRWVDGKPDLTKLVRCAEDAIKGIIWRDDNQVALQLNAKRYANPGEPTGVWIRFYRLKQQPQLLTVKGLNDGKEKRHNQRRADGTDRRDAGEPRTDQADREAV